MLERSNSEDTGGAVNVINVEFLDGASDVTKHELFAPSDKGSTAGQSAKNVDDGGIESVSEGGENAGTTVVSIRLRVLNQV